MWNSHTPKDFIMTSLLIKTSFILGHSLLTRGSSACLLGSLAFQSFLMAWQGPKPTWILAVKGLISA
jgi:hypothetical protein